MDSGVLYIVIGIVLALVGGSVWWKQEKTRELINPVIVFGISCILIGAVSIVFGLHHLIAYLNIQNSVTPIVQTPRFWHYALIILFIFLGSVSYTIAAYYHLKLEKWTFPIAFLIAVPLILIEYQFSIRGNRAASEILNLNAVQITLLTMTFYFINSWILNYFFLNKPVIWWREILAFACICIAFILTTRPNK